MRSTLFAFVGFLTAMSPCSQAQQIDQFIVTFTAGAPDLAPLRAAILDRRSASEVQSMIDELEEQARRGRSAFTQRITELGGEVGEHYWLINASSVRIPSGQRNTLAGLDGVERVWDDGLRHPADLRFIPAPIRVATNANNHNADALQAKGIMGAGVTVAIVDSGLDSSMGTSGRPHAVFYPNGNPANRTGSGLSGSRMLANTQIGRYQADNPVVSHGTRVAASAIGGRWNRTATSDHGHAPGASVVGYSLSDFQNAATELQTMVAAWQRVVIDRVKFGTSVANMSYTGTVLSQSPEQQAMDSAVHVGDILVTVSAGTSSSSFLFHSAVNVIPVGAASANTHRVPSWSAVGPLPDKRVYPLLVANGEALVTPQIDNESTSTLSNGASHAAPQVAGAAALFRSVAITATALETRAAILATTEDISDKVTIGRSGHGYLRDDRLVGLGQGGGLLKSDRVSSLASTKSFSMPVTAGLTYAAALAWNRQISSNTAWADLNLEVWQDGNLLASSAGAVDVNERVKFRARSTGTVDLRVKLKSLEPQTPSQGFAIAAAEAPDAIVDGAWQSYGVSCSSPASVSSSGINGTFPLGRTGTFGLSSSSGLFASGPHRFQIVPTQQITAAVTAHAIAFRFDNKATPGAGVQWIDLEIDIGQTPGYVQTVKANFAANRSGTVVTALSRRVIMIPPQAKANTVPQDWTLVIPLDQSVSTYPDRGGFLVDVKVYGSSAGLNYPVDADNSMSRVLYANSPTATTGTVGGHAQPIVGIVTRLTPGSAPHLTAIGKPNVGKSLTLVLNGAPANAPILFAAGASGTSWAGLSLPFDLAPFLAPRCFILTSFDALVQRTSSAAGTTTLPVQIPNSSALVGNTIYQQVVAVDPLANRLGLITSNGIAVTIGGR